MHGQACVCVSALVRTYIHVFQRKCVWQGLKGNTCAPGHIEPLLFPPILPPWLLLILLLSVPLLFCFTPVLCLQSATKDAHQCPHAVALPCVSFGASYLFLAKSGLAFPSLSLRDCMYVLSRYASFMRKMCLIVEEACIVKELVAYTEYSSPLLYSWLSELNEVMRTTFKQFMLRNVVPV